MHYDPFSQLQTCSAYILNIFCCRSTSQMFQYSLLGGCPVCPRMLISVERTLVWLQHGTAALQVCTALCNNWQKSLPLEIVSSLFGWYFTRFLGLIAVSSVSTATQLLCFLQGGLATILYFCVKSEGLGIFRLLNNKATQTSTSALFL